MKTSIITIISALVLSACATPANADVWISGTHIGRNHSFSFSARQPDQWDPIYQRPVYRSPAPRIYIEGRPEIHYHYHSGRRYNRQRYYRQDCCTESFPVAPMGPQCYSFYDEFSRRYIEHCR